MNFRKKLGRKARSAFTLTELLVSMFIFTLISLATTEFYNSASVEFEQAAINMATSQHGRIAMQKIQLILSTAAPSRIPPYTSQCFYYPDASVGPGAPPPFDNMLVGGMPLTPGEVPGVEFISNYDWLQDPANSSECTYAFDKADPSLPTTGVGNYTVVYRYYLGWSGNSSSAYSRPAGQTIGGTTYTSSAAFPPLPTGVPDNCVYLNRTQVAGSTLTPFSTTYPGQKPRILMRDVAVCTFMDLNGVFQMHLTVYGFDPITGKPLDGTLSRDLRRVRRDGKNGSSGSNYFDVTTAIPLPAVNLLN